MINLNPDDRSFVRNILDKFFPDCTFKVFGSRANGTAKRFSDLDIVIIPNSKSPSLSQIGDAREALSESDLEFRVDLSLWSDLPESFQAQIEKEATAI